MTLIEAALPDHRLINLLIPDSWDTWTYKGQRFRRLRVNDANWVGQPHNSLIQQHYGGQWRSVIVLARDVVVVAEPAAA